MAARFTNTSDFTGITRTMEFSMLEQQDFDRRYAAWRRGDKLIQEAFPMLSDDAREFIVTGVTGEEWDKYMSNPEDEPNYREHPDFEEPAF